MIDLLPCCRNPDIRRVATWCVILGPKLHSRHTVTKCQNCGEGWYGGGAGCEDVPEMKLYEES